MSERTTEKPTKSGWYWIWDVRWTGTQDEFAVPEIVFIYSSMGRLGFDLTDRDGGWVGLYEIDAEFSGPLEPPR